MIIQEIGIVINLSRGTYHNTVYKNGKLQLVELGTDSDGRTVYVGNGYWESEPILIQDKIRAFKNLVKTCIKTTGSHCKGYVKTSEDGFNWTDYIEVNEDGSINNEPAKYAKVKLELMAGSEMANFVIDKFDRSKNYNNEFINANNEILELKKNYIYEMMQDENFNEGRVFRKTIPESNFKKIDQIILIKN